MAKKGQHLYRYGAKAGELHAFEHRYGKERGKYVYGATVGKLKRVRELKHNRCTKCTTGIGIHVH